MKDIAYKITRNPVYVINAVKAFFAVAIAFGVSLNAGQQDALTTFLTAALALLAVIGMGAKLEHDTVTPVAAPHLPEDTVVKVVDVDNKVIEEKVL